ncbi:MAG: sulfite reductase subunit [Chloroflexi bacterium]|nr:sulfite reductase subunit [Chloroflexota bacterium]
MPEGHLEIGAIVTLEKPEFNRLLVAIQEQGYETLGPTIQDDTIQYNRINGLDDLPRGMTSKQDAGYYRLEYSGHNNYFDVTPGPQSWKGQFFPPRTELLTLYRQNKRDWSAEKTQPNQPPTALIGVRPCELAAIQVQDRVFLRNDLSDPLYLSRRERTFILVANCLHPGGTCFCVSMGTGPRSHSGFDLSLTELNDVFLMEIGSEAGRAILADLPWQPAAAFSLQAAERGFEYAIRHMGRTIPDVERLPEALLNDLENQQYDDVAKRCLSCTNCTQVCPTCFCWDVQEVNNLSGSEVRRERVWDSCFNPMYTYVFGGNTRPNTRSRYRQWITHKLASWYYQFGVSGCVGCGRCITWCPAGIDITAEANALLSEVKA